MAEGIGHRLRTWARQLKADAIALMLAARDPRTPQAARVLAILVLAYAASPIDLIPDFIPVLGLLDDLIIVPLGLALVLRMIPPAIVAEHRLAAAANVKVPPSKLGLAIVVGIWLAVLIGLTLWMKGRL